MEEAKKVLRRLTSPQNTNFDIDKNVTMMVATTEHERTVNEETSYRACFQSTNLKRTLIVIGIYCVQTLNGNPLRGYSTYFFQQAGLPTTQAFNLGVIGYCVALVGGVVSVRMLHVNILTSFRNITLRGLNHCTIPMQRCLYH